MRVPRIPASFAFALALAALAAFAGPLPPLDAGYALLDGLPVTEGQMRIPKDELERLGPCDSSRGDARAVPPSHDRFILEETRVDAEISGVLARVRLEQVFKNPYAERLEAIYLFPLPEDAAVDGYSFQIGELVIAGVVKERDEARREYEAARDEGREGALIEEERANVFTQSVANIPPDARVLVRVAYVHPVKIDGSDYTFRFPMVVAPRYIPGEPRSRPSLGRGWAPDTNEVADASRITPGMLPPGLRNGNDIFITVKIDAGMPIHAVTPVTHEVDVQQDSETTAVVTLRSGAAIADRDFVLDYRLAGERTAIASLAHRAEGAADGAGESPAESAGKGYVALLLQPKREVAAADIVPREVIFVLDTSGSMDGPAIRQLRITAEHVLAALDPQDTFRIVAFNSRPWVLDDHALAATPENLAAGAQFIRGLTARDGTELLPALKTALGTARGEEAGSRPLHLVLMTDALVGNDDAVLGYLRHELFEGVRVFPLAFGAAPNHYLIERAAEIGRGFAMHITNEDNAVEMAKRFNLKTSSPILTDLVLDWGALEVEDVIPSPLPDLHHGEPLLVLARYEKPGEGEVMLSGNVAGAKVETKLSVALPATEPAHDSLASAWARKRIQQIWNRNVGRETPESRAEITRLGLEHGLVTRYTSFVAVEMAAPPTDPGPLRREEVAVLLPEGMTKKAAPPQAFAGARAQPAAAATATATAQNAVPPGAQPATVAPPVVVRNPVVHTPEPTAHHVPAPSSSSGDPGFRVPRFRGGGGGGSIEWFFLAGLGLLAAARAAARKRRTSDRS